MLYFFFVWVTNIVTIVPLSPKPVPKSTSTTKAHTQKIISGPPQLKRFDWPLARERFWISCFFGTKARGRLHAGLDLAAFEGTPVYASEKGMVEEAREAGPLGNMILLKHADGYHTRYAHLSKIVVSPKKRVRKGELIGHVGKSGRTTGANGEHLHFEILKNRKPINPMPLL